MNSSGMHLQFLSRMSVEMQLRAAGLAVLFDLHADGEGAGQREALGNVGVSDEEDLVHALAPLQHRSLDGTATIEVEGIEHLVEKEELRLEAGAVPHEIEQAEENRQVSSPSLTTRAGRVGA